MIEEEKHIIAVLKNIPMFCVYRKYTDLRIVNSYIEKNYFIKFDNNYAVKIIKFTYGIFSDEEEWELCVLHCNENNKSILCYRTCVTSDLEYSAEENIDKLLVDIEAL
jgi:hypothetical protein